MQAQAGVPPRLAAEDEAPFLSAVEIAKRFGETRALISCSFAVRAGEIHALVGENGSGKSTLVKILSGVLGPDRGELKIAGIPARLASPRRAQSAGIATVFQEILTVEHLSVLDNIWLGADSAVKERVTAGEKRDRALAVLERLTPSFPSLRTPMSRLNLGQRQLAVVTRALVREPKLLILDESTSALDISDRDRLFAEIERRRATGTGVIFISHRMDEIMEVGQRVTVLRAGESVATLPREESNPTTLIRLMSGREPAAPSPSERGAQRSGSVVLRATDLVVRRAASPFDFELRAGEIVGLAGLEGHGQDDFARTLAMVTPPVDGQLSEARTGRMLRSRADATRAGVSYVPRDRKSEGIFEPLSILENFSMPTLRSDRRAGLLSRRHMRTRLAVFREQLRIRLGNELDLITTLSGGNQQKVLISRALADKPRVLVLNDPTRGVDIGAKHDIYRLLRSLAQDDVGIVLLSTELEEHILLSERVIVFRDGTLSGELGRDELSRGALVAALFGEAHEPRSHVEIGETL